jgi:hypothetical protein
MICVVNRNYDPKAGLYNGTRVQIIQILRNLIKVKILAGNTAGQEVFIGRVKFEYGKLRTEPGIPFVRIQYPLEPGFAMTINKAQGQTLERVCVDLTASQCFSHGMFYTAVSRVRSANSLRIMSGLRDKAVNVVDPEMIRGADAHLQVDADPMPPSNSSPTDTQRNNIPSNPIPGHVDTGEPMDTTSLPPAPPPAERAIRLSSVIEPMEIDIPGNNNTAADITDGQNNQSQPSQSSQSQASNNDGDKRFFARL